MTKLPTIIDIKTYFGHLLTNCLAYFNNVSIKVHGPLVAQCLLLKLIKADVCGSNGNSLKKIKYVCFIFMSLTKRMNEQHLSYVMPFGFFYKQNIMPLGLFFSVNIKYNLNKNSFKMGKLIIL